MVNRQTTGHESIEMYNTILGIIVRYHKMMPATVPLISVHSRVNGWSERALTLLHVDTPAAGHVQTLSQSQNKSIDGEKKSWVEIMDWL